MTVKIAYLTGEYPKASHTFIQREVAALREFGADVLTCSVRQTAPEHIVGDAQRAEFKNTYQLLKAAKSPVRLLGSHIRLLVSSPRRYFQALRLAWKTRRPGFGGAIYQMFYFAEAGVLAVHLNNEGVSHLHNHFGDSSGTVTMLAGALANIPYSYTMHGPTLFLEAKKWAIDEKTAQAAFVVCISHFCRSQGMLFSNHRNWDKFRIVHCGVIPENYGKRDKKQGTKRLLFVGRMAAVKGLPVLLNALPSVLEHHPDAILMLVGDGPDRKSLEREVKERGLQASVVFTGYQTEQEVAEHQSEADVFVLPSFAEGVPVVLMEAMASRTPVVATRIAGVPELVADGENGFVVSPGDEKALASQICNLLDSPDLRSKMGEAGRDKIVTDYDVRKEARWLLDIIQGSTSVGQLRPDP